MSSKLLNPFGLKLFLLLTLCSSIYGNALEKALKENNLKLQLKSYYFTKAHEIDPKESIWVNGVTLKYVSDPFLGDTTAGFTLQASDVADDEAEVSNSKFKLDMYGTGIALSEIYLAPKISKTTLKLGRQFIKSPLIYGSYTRLVEQSFQGAVITTMDIDKTIASFIHFDKFQSRTDGSGKIGKFSNVFDYVGLIDGEVTLKKGANSFYMMNNSIEDLTLHYQYLDALDFAKTHVVHGIYNLGTKANLKLTLQQYNTSWDASAPNAKSGYLNLNSAKMRGYRLQGSIKGFNLLAAYTKNDTNGDIFGGLGLSADAAVAGGKVNGGAYLKNNSAKKFAISTKLKGIDLTVAKTTYKNKDNLYKTAFGADRYTETDFIIDYNLTKNLNVNFLYAKFGGNLVGSPNYDYRSRLKLSYSF